MIISLSKFSSFYASVNFTEIYLRLVDLSADTQTKADALPLLFLFPANVSTITSDKVGTPKYNLSVWLKPGKNRFTKSNDDGIPCYTVEAENLCLLCIYAVPGMQREAVRDDPS